jgi:hypothetical protein
MRHAVVVALFNFRGYDMLCIEIESRDDGYAVVRVSDRYGFIKAYAGWNGFAAYELLNEENLDIRGRT